SCCSWIRRRRTATRSASRSKSRWDSKSSDRECPGRNVVWPTVGRGGAPTAKMRDWRKLVWPTAGRGGAPPAKMRDWRRLVGPTVGRGGAPTANPRRPTMLYVKRSRVATTAAAAVMSLWMASGAWAEAEYKPLPAQQEKGDPVHIRVYHQPYYTPSGRPPVMEVQQYWATYLPPR